MANFGIEEISIFAFLIVLMAFCIKLKKLTIMAAIAAGTVGTSVYLGDHLRGLLLLLVFFVLSVLATSYKKSAKKKIRFHGIQTAGRTAGQVYANGGVASIAALSGFIDPEHLQLYLVMMASSLASALADTLSSELGIVFGRRFFDILTLKTAEKGLDGIVSVEGTIIGAAGSLLIGLSFAGFSSTAICIAMAGVFGNYSDSILGAIFERKGFIGNNFVNFLNTLIAALVGLLFYKLIVTH